MWPFVVALSSLGCVDYGVSRKAGADTFLQAARPAGVDILWVQDDSSSMSEEREMLAETADVFVSTLMWIDVDFQLAVVSTDLESWDPGELVGAALGPDSPGLRDEFVDQVMAGRQGSTNERGLDAAVFAASPATADWARVDADLEIIVFSDEDDHSDQEPGPALESLSKARPGAAIRLNAIVGDPPQGCVSPTGAADPGLLYIDAQERTGGIRESICSPDYDGLLARVALHALGLEIRFLLSAVPDLSTLEVYVDEVLVHQRAEHGWRYDVGDNSVVFDGLAVPPPGSTIYVTYLEWFGVVEDLPDTGSP